MTEVIARSELEALVAAGGVERLGRANVRKYRRASRTGSRPAIGSSPSQPEHDIRTRQRKRSTTT